MFGKYFLAHPRSVGESYGQHLTAACGFAWTMVSGGLACFIHALVPCLFTQTASNRIRRLHHRMVTDRAAPISGDGQSPAR